MDKHGAINLPFLLDPDIALKVLYCISARRIFKSSQYVISFGRGGSESKRSSSLGLTYFIEYL
jgi:hypothetical protein